MPKSSNKLNIEIVTPSGLAYSGEVDMVVAPAVQGTVGILPNHTPYFTKLDDGEIKIKKSEKEERFTIYGGFMDVQQGGQITIMTDGAKRSEKINVEAARKAKESAQKTLADKEKLSEVDFAKAEASLRRAILDLKVAQRRKRS